MKIKFYKCPKCGKIAVLLNNSSCPTICCSVPMTELKAGAIDAAVAKHVPIVTQKDNKVLVTVSSLSHPMEEKHFIQWIVLQTNKGCIFKELLPGTEAAADFFLSQKEEIIKAYSYCNLHGLWESE